MTSRLLVAAVGLGCVSAAGMGGYLAVRTANHSSAAAPAALAAPQPAALPSPAPLPEPEPAAPTPRENQVVRPAEIPVEPVRQPRAPRPVPGPEPVRPAPAVPVMAEQPIPQLIADEVDVPDQAISALPAPAVPVAGASPVADLPLARQFDEIDLPSNTVIGIRLDTTVSSESARVEDEVRARVTRAVTLDGRTVIPTGSELRGVVTMVERGGRIRERARIGIRFTSIELDDNLRVPILTDVIYRDGDGPAGEATAKIGASAVVGSILGGVLGGKRGAVIGGAAGAAGGTAMVVSGDRSEATLASGTSLTVRLTEPVTFEIER